MKTDKTKYPQVSVIMPVYNCVEYVAESIESILNQTYPDFELIIIDDHSTDGTLEIVKSFKDERIHVYEKDVNKGMVDSLNFGISKARGKYIARMDGDDVSHPSRFEKQVKILNDHPDIDLLSANASIPGTKLVYNYATDPEQVKVDLLFGSAFVHASLMGKTDIFIKNQFDERMKHAEDYDLWSRLAFKAKMANMEEVLYDYRAHGNQVSNKYRQIQNDNCLLCQFRMFHYIPYDQSKFPDELLKKALRKELVRNTKEAFRIFKWYKKIKLINQNEKLFDVERFNRAIDLFQKKLIKLSITSMMKKEIPFSLPFLFLLITTDPSFLMESAKNKIFKSKK